MKLEVKDKVVLIEDYNSNFREGDICEVITVGNTDPCDGERLIRIMKPNGREEVLYERRLKKLRPNYFKDEV